MLQILYTYFTINNIRPIRSWQTNLLNLLAPNWWRPPASRTPANNGVPTVGFPHRTGLYRRGDNHFRPRLIGVVDTKNAFCSEDGIVYSPGAGGFTNPSQSVISQLGWGIHTVRGGIDPENHRSPFSSPVCWSRTCVWKDFRSGDGTIPPGWRWVLALRIPGWGFHTVRGGTDPGDNHVRLQYVEVVNVRKDL